MIVFSVDDRNHLRDRMLDMASSDSRVVAGALLGSLAVDEGDGWSDLDIMFAVSDHVPVMEVLEDWTETVVRESDAVPLFDLVSGAITYRVFLFPDSLELDLSFVPASEFGAGGPKFRLIWGEAVERSYESPTPAEGSFGHAVHHAMHARACIERGRYWQAEYWISALRDHALALACRRRELDGGYGRDFDRLPVEVLEPFNEALLRGSDGTQAIAERVERQLRELIPEREPGSATSI